MSDMPKETLHTITFKISEDAFLEFAGKFKKKTSPKYEYHNDKLVLPDIKQPTPCKLI